MRIGLLILLSLATAFAPSASALACGQDHVLAGGSGAAGEDACCCVEKTLPSSCSSCDEAGSSDSGPQSGDAQQDCLCGHTAPQNTCSVANETVVETVRLVLHAVAERDDCLASRESKQSRAIDGSNSHPEVRLPLLL